MTAQTGDFVYPDNEIIRIGVAAEAREKHCLRLVMRRETGVVFIPLTHHFLSGSMRRRFRQENRAPGKRVSMKKQIG